jgi:hypothetical protein
MSITHPSVKLMVATEIFYQAKPILNDLFSHLMFHVQWVPVMKANRMWNISFKSVFKWMEQSYWVINIE